MLEEQRKASIEYAQKIEEAEAVCAKVFDQVSHAWEALIEDAKLEKVEEELHMVEAEVNQMKRSMRKLPL